jgi:dephospho-CoA kinase
VPYIIGVTGGIGTGKSAVTKYLADRYQLPILDMDLYAREAVAVGSVVLASIVQRYGPEILWADGSLNRAGLGAILFTQPDERQWLEALIHPVVRRCFARDVAASSARLLVAAIPLLFEAHLESLVSEIWVVACRTEQQLARVQERDRLTLAQVQQRLDSQLPLATKISQADLVLDNSDSLAHLYQQIDLAMATRADCL